MRRSASTFMLVALATTVLRAQQEQTLATGKVSDEAGAPIANAQVVLEGMGLAALTNDSGVYRLAVPAARTTGQPATITVRRLGFRPRSAKLALTPGVHAVDFVLAPQAVVLQQVVVTGEGTITTNEKLGATVNTVEGSQLVNSGETNLVNALSAKAPNVQVQSQSGDPGSSTSIQIRGIKTFTGTAQPLFVVDGVPLDNTTNTLYSAGDVVAPNRIADINPNDIESVTILKGAAASAIFGARASQGVVLITTKKGQSGVTRYDLQASYSANEVTQGFPLQTSYGQTSPCDSVDCRASSDSWGPALALGTPTYDHFAELFQTGALFDVTLAISGGDERRSFYFSGGYAANQGFVVGPNDSYDRVSFNVKASQAIGDRMQLSAKLSYANTWGAYTQRGNNRSGLMLDGLRTPPEFNNAIYLDTVAGVPLQRSYRFPYPGPDSYKSSRGYDNPFFMIFEEPSSSTLQRVYGNLDLNWQANDWLTLQWTPGLDYYTDQRSEGLPWSNSTDPLGFVYRADFQSFIVSSVLTLVGQHTFSPTVAGTFTLGNEINSSMYSQNLVMGDDLVTPAPLVIRNLQVDSVPQFYDQVIHRQSYFAQATGDFWSELYLTLAIRNDGYSTFAQNYPRAWYPKASVAWTFTNGMSLAAHGPLQYGKLRVAYGQTGKEPPPYSTLTGYDNTPFGPGLTTSDSLGNNTLRPERQKELEGGLDLGFFDGLANLNATVYTSTADNVIIQLPLAPASGASSRIENGASVQNDGAELELNLNSTAKRNVQWSVGLMWAKNRNRVLSIANGVTQVPVGGSFSNSFAVAQVGHPVGALALNDYYRCGRHETYAGIDLDNTAGQCLGAPNGALYIPAGGYPAIDLDTLLVLGSAQPNWTGAIRGSVTLMQKLQFSVLLDVRDGSQAYNGTRQALYAFGTHKDTDVRGQTLIFGSTFHAGPVAGPGVGTPVLIDQSWFQGDGSAFGYYTADFLENAGFTKLREVAIQYTWDGRWVTDQLGLSSMSLRIAGRNLATWTKYTGIDPESNLEGATSLVQGVDWFNDPQTRSFVFTVGLHR